MAKRFNRDFSFDKVSLDQIIGAPLRATAAANAMMAKEQIRFIMDFCFRKHHDYYEPVMIEMVMTTSKVEPGESPEDPPVLRRFTTKFSLPLLTLIPLNSLAVENFEIAFDMEVTSMEGDESSFDLERNEERNEDKKQDYILMGKVTNTTENHQYERRSDAKLSVNVQGGQLPLPVGLTSILDLYKNNIEPIEIIEE